MIRCFTNDEKFRIFLTKLTQHTSTVPQIFISELNSQLKNGMTNPIVSSTMWCLFAPDLNFCFVDLNLLPSTACFAFFIYYPAMYRVRIWNFVILIILYALCQCQELRCEKSHGHKKTYVSYKDRNFFRFPRFDPAPDEMR